MRFVESPYPPGTIIVPQDHLGRYPEFEISLERVQVPVGTVMVRPRSGSCAFNCNQGVRNRRGAWTWFIDDDQTFEPDIVLRLLAHDKPLVAPLVPMRYPPFELVMYKTLSIGPGGFECDFYRLADLGKQTGLMEVAGLPKAGLLVKDEVWRKLPDPWFKVGRIRPDEIDDDRFFMWEVRQAGYTLWADLDQAMPHMRTFALKVRRDQFGALELCGVLGNREVGIVP